MEEIIKLLFKPLWSNQDIMTYIGCKKDKASQIHRAAVKNHGLSRLCPNKVKRDAVLEVLGLCWNDEIKKLKQYSEEN